MVCQGGLECRDKHLEIMTFICIFKYVHEHIPSPAGPEKLPEKLQNPFIFKCFYVIFRIVSYCFIHKLYFYCKYLLSWLCLSRLSLELSINCRIFGKKFQFFNGRVRFLFIYGKGLNHECLTCQQRA